MFTTGDVQARNHEAAVAGIVNVEGFLQTISGDVIGGGLLGGGSHLVNGVYPQLYMEHPHLDMGLIISVIY